MIDLLNEYCCQQGQFTVSTDKSRLDVSLIHDFLSRSYWAVDIPLSIVQKSIKYSLCFGLYDEHAENGSPQIGFARVISDLTTFAYLCDVFILETYRGQGLGKWLVACIIEHPDLQGLKRFMLGTRDAHGLYRQFGFRTVQEMEGQSQLLMAITRPNPYKRDA